MTQGRTICGKQFYPLQLRGCSCRHGQPTVPFYQGDGAHTDEPLLDGSSNACKLYFLFQEQDRHNAQKALRPGLPLAQENGEVPSSITSYGACLLPPGLGSCLSLHCVKLPTHKHLLSWSPNFTLLEERHLPLFRCSFPPSFPSKMRD